MEMEIPVIDFSKLKSEKRGQTMALLHEACQKWGFFMIENHDVDTELMEKVKALTKAHYDHYMKPGFLDSDAAKSLSANEYVPDMDWESTFFICHRPDNTINDIAALSQHLRQSMDKYIDQVIALAEKLSELMCENLGISRAHMMEAFAGSRGPSVGTKVAMYPECPHPELMRGLREHTDAGGIILLLQDDQVPGLEFLKGGEWVKIPPSKNNRIFVNIGDQVEIVSNGVYKSAVHRVMAMKEGNRISVATFYNPGGDAVISPAAELLLPRDIQFKDYLKLYTKTKFGDKAIRFQSLKTSMAATEN
ncbi:1-aminocyclopropane-1-carboxylate oxidase 1-like isoform X2 [Salvia miltiorrhiza]|uniref:1-aminocyclopropane-1-carboxylate oxidase 1-like isoform X2 n=1 Tax=Salvia miltiorrhiza TaxID=226208 RepID=UPI0025AC662C|nr:1-aminocyclopropane-1-carboxylate oxidase 1-like isoform X2 [Salvia miltiorrhiza]XP_057765752.1 1-aminocyclopropane-1-carboxylate oxidase 1-like isoform X2 [Salvia miltiorrhiza]